MQAELPDALLRDRTRLPLLLRRFVAAGMDPVTREEREHLGQHVLHEVNRRVGRVENVLIHAPVREDLELLAGVAEPGVGGDGGLRVAGHLDFRDDGNEARLRVRDDFTDVVLRVEPAVRNVVVHPLRRVGIAALHADERLAAPGTDRREQRILLDLDAPPLIVREVPVEPIQLMERQEVDVLLDEFLRHERARHVEMRAAPLEARHVFDLHHGDAPRQPGDQGLAEVVGRQQLPQRLDGVECAGRTKCPNRDAAGSHGEPVTLVAEA